MVMMKKKRKMKWKWYMKNEEEIWNEEKWKCEWIMAKWNENEK